MPELPEVETVARGIRNEIGGAILSGVHTTRDAMRYPFPSGLNHLAGIRITGVERRAKYILITLSNEQTLIVHLGMSGRIRFADSHYIPQKHDHFLMTADNGKTLVFNDARRFGFVDLIETVDLAVSRHLKHLGFEPFDARLDGKTFFALTQKAKTPVKAFLLNQKNVVGIGNIYACEALFQSGINPEIPTYMLTQKQVMLLLVQVRTILENAIRAGGSTLRDYTLVDGSLGRFQFAFNVYDREGCPCPNPRCSNTVKRIIQSGRSTFYCPSCQKTA